jgi:hypothetical protein
MTSRMFAAGIVVFAVAASGETGAAWAAGFVSVPSLPARSAVGPAVARVPFAHTFQHRGMVGSFPLRLNGSRVARMRDDRQLGFPLWWGYASNPSENVAPYEQRTYAYPAYPIENWEERSRPVVTYEPGCRTDTQKVPSDSGGEHSINITRCY